MVTDKIKELAELKEKAAKLEAKVIAERKAELAALSQKVKAVAGTDNVEFDLRVDPALIGGFVVSLGSQVIDASLAGQVRRLGLALAKAS